MAYETLIYNVTSKTSEIRIIYIKFCNQALGYYLECVKTITESKESSFQVLPNIYVHSKAIIMYTLDNGTQGNSKEQQLMPKDALPNVFRPNTSVVTSAIVCFPKTN